MKTLKIHSIIQSLEATSLGETHNKFLEFAHCIHDLGFEDVLQEEPKAMYRAIKKIIEMDGSIVMNESSQVSDIFVTTFWQSTAFLASQSKMSDFLSTISKININIEASDSPLSSNLAITEGKLEGNCGLVPFSLEDYRLMGRTNVLLAYFIGELPLGLNNLEIQTAGHSGFNPVVGKVFRTIQNLHRPD